MRCVTFWAATPSSSLRSSRRRGAFRGPLAHLHMEMPRDSAHRGGKGAHSRMVAYLDFDLVTARPSGHAVHFDMRCRSGREPRPRGCAWPRLAGCILIWASCNRRRLAARARVRSACCAWRRGHSARRCRGWGLRAAHGRRAQSSLFIIGRAAAAAAAAAAGRAAHLEQAREKRLAVVRVLGNVSVYVQL